MDHLRFHFEWITWIRTKTESSYRQMRPRETLFGIVAMPRILTQDSCCRTFKFLKSLQKATETEEIQILSPKVEKFGIIRKEKFKIIKMNFSRIPFAGSHPVNTTKWIDKFLFKISYSVTIIIAVSERKRNKQRR